MRKASPPGLGCPEGVVGTFHSWAKITIFIAWFFYFVFAQICKYSLTQPVGSMVYGNHHPNWQYIGFAIKEANLPTAISHDDKVCPIKMLLGHALIIAKWPGGNLYPASTHCTPFPVYKGQNQPKILFWFLKKENRRGREVEKRGWMRRDLE